MRKGFNFYNSYWEQIKLLDDKQKLQIFNAICGVQFLEKNIEDIIFKDKMLILVWTGIKHSIETSLNGYLSKQKALNKDVEAPLTKGLDMGSPQQVKEKEEVKEKEKYTPFFLSTIQIEEIISYRKSIKKPLKTNHGIKLMENSFKEIIESGYSFEAVFHLMISKEWQSIKLEWVQKELNTPINNLDEITKANLLKNPNLGGYN